MMVIIKLFPAQAGKILMWMNIVNVQHSLPSSAAVKKPLKQVTIINAQHSFPLQRNDGVLAVWPVDGAVLPQIEVPSTSRFSLQAVLLQLDYITKI